MARLLVMMLLTILLGLSTLAQSPGIEALIRNSTDIVVVSVTATHPRRAIEGARDTVALQVVQSFKGALKTDDPVNVYYHLLWIDNAREVLEPVKFTVGKEYIVFLTARQQLRTGEKPTVEYQLTDHWLAVQPSYPKLITEISTTIRAQRLNLYDPGLSQADKTLLKAVAELRCDEILAAETVEPTMPGVIHNNALILNAWQIFTTGHGAINLMNHVSSREGDAGWQYLAITGNTVAYIRDPREDRSAADKRIQRTDVDTMRVVFRDTEHDNALLPFDGKDAAGKVLFLQVWIGDAFVTFG